MRAMNRKAFLLGEFTLKVIIAVLCILVLVALMVGIYGAFSKKAKLAQAEFAVEEVVKRIRTFSTNSLAVDTYTLTNPKEWVLVYYSAGEPLSCEGSPCLCICEEEGWFSNQLEKCNDVGVCRKIEQPLQLEKPVVIDVFTRLIFSKRGGVIRLTRRE